MNVMKELSKEKLIDIIKEGIKRYSTLDGINTLDLTKHLTPIKAADKYFEKITNGKYSEKQKELFDEYLCEFCVETYGKRVYF